MARTLPYDPRIRKAHTTDAAKTIKSYLKPSRSHPVSIYSVGKCPRCKHDTDHTRRLRVWGAVGGGGKETTLDLDLPADFEKELDEVLRTGELEFSVRCDCQVEHPKTPGGKKGCGAGYNLHVKW